MEGKERAKKRRGRGGQSMSTCNLMIFSSTMWNPGGAHAFRRAYRSFLSSSRQSGGHLGSSAFSLSLVGLGHTGFLLCSVTDVRLYIAPAVPGCSPCVYGVYSVTSCRCYNIRIFQRRYRGRDVTKLCLRCLPRVSLISLPSYVNLRDDINRH